MERLLMSLLLAIVALSLFGAIAPMLVALAHVLVLLVAVVTVAVGVLRVIWHLTNHY